MELDMTPARLIMQRTLRSSIYFIGIGLHSGQRVSMAVHPARPDSGITFIQKMKYSASATIPATWEYVVSTDMCTVIGDETGAMLSTVEHILAALSGCYIDNALIEVSGSEVPILDGSAMHFVNIIARTGSVIQSSPRKALRVLKPVCVRQHERWARLEPSPTPRFTVEIDFAAKAIGRQQFTLDLAREGSIEEVASARTFGFLSDIQKLRGKGLAVGGSLKNSIVVHGDQVLNQEDLRFADEFVRHKVLDCIGDIALAGAPVLGHLTTYKPGHSLNRALLQALMTQPQAWDWVNLRTADINGVAPSHTSSRPATSGWFQSVRSIAATKTNGVRSRS